MAHPMSATSGNTDDNPTMPVGDLTESDIYADLARFLSGDDEVDGIGIEDVEFDDETVRITLCDTAGDTRMVDLRIVPS
ncbi:hypothetical protein OG225_42910 (plasmid) [Nocardia sp. NBC_01377]|uniref:hypothetical protein n=1 Tax=Nocardia sp. NBC_01377 TaxID=2903595 RepID=UPI002F9191A2